MTSYEDDYDYDAYDGVPPNTHYYYEDNFARESAFPAEQVSLLLVRTQMMSSLQITIKK